MYYYLSDLSLKVSRQVDKFCLCMTVYNKYIQHKALVECHIKGANYLTISITVLNKMIITNITMMCSKISLY